MVIDSTQLMYVMGFCWYLIWGINLGCAIAGGVVIFHYIYEQRHPQTGWHSRRGHVRTIKQECLSDYTVTEQTKRWMINSVQKRSRSHKFIPKLANGQYFSNR